MTNKPQHAPLIEAEDFFYLSLYEVTCSFGVSPEAILDIIDEGIIPAHQDEHFEWRFDSEAIRRIQVVLRLQRDLGVNLAGAGLVLELLDRIAHLERQHFSK